MGVIPSLQARGAHYSNLIARLEKLKGSMSLSRKVFRFGKEIPLLCGIRSRIKAQEPQTMVVTRTLGDILLALYFWTDHPLFFHSIGYKTFEANKLARQNYINNIFWLLSSLCDIAASVVDL